MKNDDYVSILQEQIKELQEELNEWKINAECAVREQKRLQEKCKFLKECEESATEVYNSNLNYLYKTECEAVAILKGLQDFIYITDDKRTDELTSLQNRIEMFLEEHKV